MPILRFVHALAREGALDVMTASEDWTAYVRRVTRGLDRKDIADAADINVSGVSRWLTATSRPSAEKVVSFARGLDQDPIQALIAAGYLLETEGNNPTVIVQSLTELSDDAFLDELRDRLRRAADQVQPGAAERLGAKLNRSKFNRKGMGIQQPENGGQERL